MGVHLRVFMQEHIWVHTVVCESLSVFLGMVTMSIVYMGFQTCMYRASRLISGHSECLIHEILVWFH